MDNCYKLWTLKEEQLLMDLYQNKKLKIYEISNILKRTSGAINSRLQKLLINNSNNNNEILEELLQNIKSIKEDIKYIKEEMNKMTLNISFIDV